MLERAVGIDPSFAPAWDALGLRYYYDGEYADGGEQMLKRSDSAFERAVALDPNLILAAGQLIINRTDRGEVGNVYAEATALVKRRPESASAHFVLGYVLRYAGLLDDAGRECDTAVKLDRGNYQFRSCARGFMELGQPQKAMEFVRLDAGSQYAANIIPTILLSQGKLDDARESLKRMSSNVWYRREFLQACLDSRRTPQLKKIGQEMETAALGQPDAEPRYVLGTVLTFCGEEDAAVRVLKSAIEQNYCAYTALQTDPLLAKLRGTPEFSELLTAAKECQNRFLARRDQSPH